MPTRRRQLRTLDYSQEARDRLARAVTTARLAAGHKWRTDFAKAAKVSIRSLTALELGQPGVGQSTLFAVASALPGWNPETPRIVLEGGPIPEPPTAPTLRRPLTDTEKQIFALYLEQLRSRIPEPEAMRRVMEIARILEQDAALVAAAIKQELEYIG